MRHKLLHRHSLGRVRHFVYFSEDQNYITTPRDLSVDFTISFPLDSSRVVLVNEFLTCLADVALVLLCIPGYENLNRANSIVNMICLMVMYNSCVSS